MTLLNVLIILFVLTVGISLIVGISMTTYDYYKAEVRHDEDLKEKDYDKEL